MQQDTDLARLLGGLALPLTLLAQGTGTATADAGSIHQTQAPLGFSTVFMREQVLVSRTAQCRIGLQNKVVAREAARFPGQTHLRGSVAGGRSRVC